MISLAIDSSGQISKWAMELSEHVVHFEKGTAIKSQIVALVPESPWLIYCDGDWGSAGARVAVVLISHSAIKLRYVARLQLTSEVDKCTNNITKHETILLGLLKLRVNRV
jgi:hypothetical protein